METFDTTKAGQHELAGALRDLAWTIQRVAVPESTGIEPVPATEVAALKQVLAAPGMTVSELSRNLGMQQSNASAAVRSLVERGLLDRSRRPDDRRVTTLTPTEKLLAEQELIETAWSGTIHEAMARLDPGQIETLVGAVDALRTLDGALRSERTER